MASSILEGFKRIGCIIVCWSCLRPADKVRSKGRFGDYSLCARCHEPKTSKDEAFWVKP